MGEGCPLKVRTYARFGLPMILPFKETAIHESVILDPWWFMEIPNEPGAMVENKDEIIAFARTVRGKRCSKEEMSKVFGVGAWETRRLDFISSVYEKKITG